MMLNFDFDELYYFIKSAACMSLFEKMFKLIKKTKPNQTKPTIIDLIWFGFNCLIGLIQSEKSLNHLEVGFV